MKRTVNHGDMIADCGHVDSEGEPDQPIRILHMVNGVQYWTDADGTRTRIPCEWIFACEPCYAAAGGDPKNITLPMRSAPYEGDDIDLGDAEVTEPLDQLASDALCAVVVAVHDQLGALSEHDRRRVLGMLVARDFVLNDDDAHFASWFLATDAVRTRYRRDLEPAGSWSPEKVPTAHVGITTTKPVDLRRSSFFAKWEDVIQGFGLGRGDKP